MAAACFHNNIRRSRLFVSLNPDARAQTRGCAAGDGSLRRSVLHVESSHVTQVEKLSLPFQLSSLISGLPSTELPAGTQAVFTIWISDNVKTCQYYLLSEYRLNQFLLKPVAGSISRISSIYYTMQFERMINHVQP